MDNTNAVIWDVDGTLVDTAQLHFQAWAKLAAEKGLPFTRVDFDSTFGWRNQEIIPKLFGIHSAKEIAKLSDYKEDLYRSQARNGVALLPGARALLNGLQAAGFLQAIGSSAPRANLALILESTSTAQFFSAVASMEDTRRGKPDPEVFLNAAGKLGVEPHRCLVIEDAPVGVQAAKAGGMKCIAVTFIGHHDPATLQAAGADRIVPTLEAVAVEDVRAILNAS